MRRDEIEEYHLWWLRQHERSEDLGKAVVLALIVLVLITLLISPAFAAADSGTLRICRPARFTALLDRKAVTIPKGSPFAQDTGGPDGRIGSVLVTTEDVSIGPKPACATAAAKVQGAQGLTLPRASHLLAQFNIPGAEFQARIVGGFTPQ